MFERLREKIAYLIFPEFHMYMDAAVKLGKAEENYNCVEILEKSDSACAEWAIEKIKTKYLTLDEVKDMLDE